MLDECMSEQCRCECHHQLDESSIMRYMHGVRKYKDNDGRPFVRKGIFPFLKLPGEIWEKVYGFAFLQDGNKRTSAFTPASHRGSIHTALLGTCRQVHKEAGHLPLSINVPNFPSALHAIDFLGFILSPTQSHLLTSIHIEFYYRQFTDSSWELLLRRLSEMSITHLGLTVKGGYSKTAFDGNSFIVNDIAATMKGIKSFDLILGSGMISKKIKAEIQEQMRKVLIKGYKCAESTRSKGKAKAKRTATGDNGGKKPAQKTRRAVQVVSHPSILLTKHQLNLFAHEATDSARHLCWIRSFWS